MFFEILIEDQSGEIMLQELLPKMISSDDTFKIHKYKGVGHIPKDLNQTIDPSKRVLLNQLPRLLAGFGRTHASYGETYQAVVIVIVDLDSKCLIDFKQELVVILENCTQKPNTLFCLAIEEGEAWLLGDTNAIKDAYPSAKSDILTTYTNDSICGTWETLANAIYPKGSSALKKHPYSVIGAEKCNWASKITPRMDINNNKSPSFNYFYKKIKGLVSINN
ncbi:MAG TPA: hypothetical protein CFH84_05015 [Sulfurimonas sp. UBA12504]|nr:MAG: hypothetical protein A2019_05410 [Sulfurimonas sp. GWF2_37_8]DAB30282.1 MAG TPA: hypothetical protein CFH84_05015 [Sulfurimonas sp. UBA12504]